MWLEDTLPCQDLPCLEYKVAAISYICNSLSYHPVIKKILHMEEHLTSPKSTNNSINNIALYFGHYTLPLHCISVLYYSTLSVYYATALANS